MNEHTGPPTRAASPSQRASPSQTDSPQSLLNPSRHVNFLNEYKQKTNKSVECVFTEQPGPAHLKVFTCKYIIDGREYGEGTGSSKLEAKREAARLTWEQLMLEKNGQMANPQGALRTDDASADPGTLHTTEINFKGKLYEYCQQKRQSLTFEELERRGPPHNQQFVSRAVVDGRIFKEGEGKSKREAEHKAAQNALTELESVSTHTDSEMLSPERVLRTDAASADPGTLHTTEINFKGKLHEYCQQKRQSLAFEELERRGPPHDQQFVSRAVVDGRKFKEGEGKSKREAEHKAAQNALTELESGSTHADSENDILSKVQSHQEKSSRRTSSSPQHSKHMENNEFDEKGNYIGKLHEYCQKNKLLLKFEELNQSGPPHNRKFVVQAVVGNRKYKSGEGKNKKMAEQKAAYYTLAELAHLAENSEVPAVAPPVRAISQRAICQQVPSTTSESTLSSCSATDSTATDYQAVEDGIKNLKLDDASCFEELPSDTNHKNDKVKTKMRKEKVLAPNFSVKLKEHEKTYSVNESFNKDFEDISQLGKGGFGHVFKARKKIDQKYYAVKKVKLRNEKAYREISTLAELTVHENIVRYYHAWTGTDIYFDVDASTSYSDTSENHDLVKCLFIQMELCEGTLKDWIRDRDKIDEKLSFSIFEQMVQGVKYIHSKNLIHRDLKPSNIFLSEESKIKIGDFGLVTSVADPDNMALELTVGTGTLAYMAPEQKTSKNYRSEVDIYALGLILYELLWIFKTDAEKYRHWDDIRNGTFPDEFVKKYHTQVLMIKKMLSSSPRERPTAASILMDLNKINAKIFQKTF